METRTEKIWNFLKLIWNRNRNLFTYVLLELLFRYFLVVFDLSKDYNVFTPTIYYYLDIKWILNYNTYLTHGFDFAWKYDLIYYNWITCYEFRKFLILNCLSNLSMMIFFSCTYIDQSFTKGHIFSILKSPATLDNLKKDLSQKAFLRFPNQISLLEYYFTRT